MKNSSLSFHKKIVPVQKIEVNVLKNAKIDLWMVREDMLHPKVSGNKFRKLKYNILEAKKQNATTLLSFGGAFSNHIAALAAAGKELGLKTIGVIRGEELAHSWQGNPTLAFADSCGMQLYFVSRANYRKKEEKAFLQQLQQQFGEFYLLPEGGTNQLAIKGCAEILQNVTMDFDYCCVPVGTGGTMAGLVQSVKSHQKVLGFSVLKGTFQHKLVEKNALYDNFVITDKYAFEGYGKIDGTLVRFINNFKKETGIPLDPIYTGKMMYGIFEMERHGEIKENSRIIAIHTGGLQGIEGMNQRLMKKNLPQIEL